MEGGGGEEGEKLKEGEGSDTQTRFPPTQTHQQPLLTEINYSMDDEFGKGKQ